MPVAYNAFMLPKVSIVVLNYNNWPDTVECLESLMRLEYENLEVLLVDNASGTDASVFERRRAGFEQAFKEFSFIQTGKNSGYAGGNNAGIRRALENGAEWILVLNNDTTVTPGFLGEMLQFQYNKDFGNPRDFRNPDIGVGILGPKILEPDGRMWSLGGRFNWNFFSVTRGILDTKYQIPNTKYHSCDYLSGTAMLVHRSVFETIGLLPEAYFLYYEDFEFCLKARAAGFFVGVVPEAVITHKVSRATRAGSPLYVYYHFRNSLLFTRRNIKPPLRWAIYLFSIWWALKQATKLLIPYSRANGGAGLKGMKDFWLWRY